MTKDGTVSDPGGDGSGGGGGTIHSNRLGTTQKVGGEQVESRASDTIVGGKAMEKDGVINGIKGSGKIK